MEISLKTVDHSERAMDFSNCTVDEIYVNSGFLKSLMTVQATCSILCLISTALTAKRVYRTVLIDVPFKLFLLARFYFLAPCEVPISGTWCYSTRFLSNAPMFGLPFVNGSLTVFRLLIFLFRSDCTRKKMRILRICELLAVVCFVGDSSYRYWGVEFPERVAYCTGNMVQLAAKLNLQSYISLGVEVATNGIGIWLFRQHKLDLCHKDKRSYDVNVVLMRRQIMYTYILFLPYSILHTLCFALFNLISIVYRSNFYSLPEPDYSAGSGFTNIPQYFSVISPWILYFIVTRAESKRASKTQILISEEKNAQNVYFDMVAKQWDLPKDTPVSSKKTKKNKVFSARSTRIVSKEETQSNPSING